MTPGRARTGRVCLEDGWQVQSSAKVDGDGAALSRPGGGGGAWFAARLPATVLGALAEAGELVDPYFGDNLRQIPGQGPPAQNFANHPMPPDSPFAVSWWFRRDFRVPAEAGPFLRLVLDGVNYRANVWLNGRKIADAETLVGAYRVHELDVTGLVDRAGDNALAIEVFPPDPCALAISWVDWNPSPPDKNMGLWRDVWLRWSGPVSLETPMVESRVDEPTLARLTVHGELVNHSDAPQTATVHAAIEGRRVFHTATLAPGERRRFAIGADEFPELRLQAPRLWWPRGMGAAALYDAELAVSVDGAPSDAMAFQFGVRQVECTLTPEGHARFTVNGEPVLVRGAGWACDLFLRRDRARDRAQLEYVKALGLNTIRFEGMLEREDFLEACDREGLMVIAGWCCCDCWEKWDKWGGECHEVAPASLRSQVRRVRRHPCLITWMYGSDFPPPPEVEARYLDVLREEGWPNPFHSSAANKPTTVTGPSGMKMEGPYEWVPPNYWYEDTARGGAWGFATEISPGPAIPPVESLRKMLPPEHLWPPGDLWKHHAGGQEFHDLSVFLDALAARYGAPRDVEELARLAQLATYEAQRAMFEAYTVRDGRATGVIQWMLDNAWPSLIWHLFDWYLRPGGGFFGTRKACQPLHVLHALDDRGVWIVNQHPRPQRGLEVHARVLDAAGTLHHEARATVDVPARGRERVLVLPALDLPGVRFVDLRASAAGEPLADNFYWLPAEPDVIDFAAASWRYAPVSRFADLRALRELPAASLVGRASRDGRTGVDEIAVELRNPGASLAFFVQARLTDGRGDDVLPVLWSDNYVSLLPGERRTLRARLLAPTSERELRVELTGINIATSVLVAEREERVVRSAGLSLGGVS